MLKLFVPLVVVGLFTSLAAAAEPRLIVQVGSTAARSTYASRPARALRDATESALAKGSPGLVLGAARRSSRGAFYVDPEIVSVERTAGRLRCTVTMLLSTQVNLKPFAVASGSVTVTNPIPSSEVDCITAVVEGLVASEVLPALRQRAHGL